MKRTGGRRRRSATYELLPLMAAFADGTGGSDRLRTVGGERLGKHVESSRRRRMVSTAPAQPSR